MKKWYKNTLAEMVIENNLTMEKVYKTINDYIKQDKEINSNLIIPINNSNYKIKFYSIINSIMRFTVGDNYFSVLQNPIKYKMITNDEEEINLEIISISQLDHIVKEYGFNMALIYCPKCKNNSNDKYFSLDYEKLKFHEKHEHVCIKESIPLKKLSKNEFNSFFNENFNFIDQDIEPKKYEPNFELYFNHSEIILKKNYLHIFQDKYQNRVKMSDKVDSLMNSNSLVHYFGQPGKGKTLYLIGVLKYLMPHEALGTFYINCKTLSKLNKPLEVKQLIIDEIPFLFYGNHDDYLNCIKEIINYQYNENTSSFFEFVNLVIDQIIENSKKKLEYILVFDQYNDKYDKDGKELEKLYDKLIKNKNEKIKDINFFLLTFSSMNNKDIRKYKIQYLKNKINKENDKHHSLREIENYEYDLTIDNGGIYDENLKKLGYGLKYYNILLYYYENEKEREMDDFIQTIKLRIRINLFDFFDVNINDLSDPKNFKILCSFSTNVPYSKDNILKIINYIPYKYFDTIHENNNDEYLIVFSFPLVGEVLNEIYSDIINTNPNIYNNLTNTELDGGAKGKLFEKIVTYYLNKESKININKDSIKYFKDYLINYHDEVEVLVLNDNEKPEKVIFKKHLEKGIYLITQKRYNGKAIDIALINNTEIKEIIGIQISIHKKPIFTITQISEFLVKLKQNIEKYYDFEINFEGLYFCYIFDNNNKDIAMIKKCKENNIKYIFFDVTNNNFLDDKYFKIDNLKTNLLSFSSILPDIKNNIGDLSIIDYFKNIPEETKDNKVINYEILNGPLIQINQKQKNSILKLFKSNLNLKSYPKLEYRNSMKWFTNQYVSKKQELSITKSADKKNENSVVMIDYNLKMHLIKESGDIYAYDGNILNNYDYYVISS